MKQGSLFTENAYHEPVAAALPTQEEAERARDRALAEVEANASKQFGKKAREFVLRYLKEHGATPGEKITQAGTEAGILTAELRAWGPVYMRLVREGIIKNCGYCKRVLGNGTSGGNIWGLAE